MAKRASEKAMEAAKEYNLREARLIAVSAEDQATVTFDCMANRLRAVNDPLWLLCAARAAMQRASDALLPVKLPDGKEAGALVDACEFLRDWRK